MMLSPDEVEHDSGHLKPRFSWKSGVFLWFGASMIDTEKGREMKCLRKNPYQIFHVIDSGT